MQRLTLIPLLLFSPLAEANYGWSIGVHTGANALRGASAEWATGPSFGVQIAKALPSGAEWRWLLRTSPIHLKDGSGSLSTLTGSHNMALEAISIQNHCLTTLRYAPLPVQTSGNWAFGPALEGGIGLNVMRTHTDLATPEEIGRISNLESALMVQAGLGLHSVHKGSFVIDVGLAGQAFAAFDRAERGGGDRLAVFFGLQPGLEFSGQF